MRDKLIELLKKDPCQSPFNCDQNCKYAHLRSCLEERFADHLLANGIIVPPCNTGDRIWSAAWSVRPHDVLKIEITIEDGKTEAIIVTDDWNYSFDEIGKSVFLTREEAERSLRENEQND